METGRPGFSYATVRWRCAYYVHAYIYINYCTPGKKETTFFSTREAIFRRMSNDLRQRWNWVTALLLFFLNLNLEISPQRLEEIYAPAYVFGVR